MITAAQISFEFTLEDAAAPSEFVYSQSTINQRWFLRFLLYVASLGATCVSLLCADAFTLFNFGVGAVISAIFIFAYTQMLWPNPTVTTRRRLRYVRGSSPYGIRTVSIEADGVSTKHQHGYSYIGWVGITRAVITDRHLILLFSTGSAMPVPRRAFRSEQEFLAWCRLIQERLAENTTTSGFPHSTGGFPVGQS